MEKEPRNTNKNSTILKNDPATPKNTKLISKYPPGIQIQIRFWRHGSCPRGEPQPEGIPTMAAIPTANTLEAKGAEGGYYKACPAHIYILIK